MIVCTKFRSYEKNTLQGFADLFIEKWKLHIRGCTLHMKNGKRWISFPGQEFEVEGEKKFYPLIRIEENQLYEAFQESAKKAIDKFCFENAEKEKCVKIENQEVDEDVPF